MPAGVEPVSGFVHPDKADLKQKCRCGFVGFISRMRERNDEWALRPCPKCGSLIGRGA